MAANFKMPEVFDNPEGWGPSAVPSDLSDLPYHTYTKGERIGKVCPAYPTLAITSL